MPDACPVACIGPCHGRNLVYGGKHLCPACRKLKGKDQYAYRKDDPIRKLYDRRWETFKRWLRGMGNVRCQRIEDGQRCNHPVEIFHHLISPRANPDPRLFLNAKNVVGVCRYHHSDILQDDPNLYVPTVVAMGILGEAAPDTDMPTILAPATAPLFYTSAFPHYESAPPVPRPPSAPAEPSAPRSLTGTWAEVKPKPETA